MLIRSLLVVSAALVGCASHHHGPTAAKASDATLAKFRNLEGTWKASYPDLDMPPTTAKYETIAAGSAVVETVFEGQPHEMITVIHLDGERLVCTHYCAAQNQPNLVASEITENTVQFVTDHVSNLASPDALYMGEARWEFVDDDTIRTRWGSFENGERGDVLNVTAVRIKDE